MSNLEQYYGKNVIITDNDGIIYKGYVGFYESASNNDNGEDSIAIFSNPEAKEGFELYESEIVKIEVVE